MNTRIRASAVVAAATVLGLSAPARGQQSQGPSATFESVNVCERVSGELVAKAVSGRAIDARPVNLKNVTWARCVYGTEIDGARRAFVLWLNPESDFEGLRKAAGKAAKSVSGVGDGAFVTFDDETKRYSLTAFKRGAVTIQITGEQQDWVRRIALLALSTF